MQHQHGDAFGDDVAPAFSQSEGRKLRELVREHGQQDWDLIASKLSGKTPRDCQAFWTGVVLSESKSLEDHGLQFAGQDSSQSRQEQDGDDPVRLRDADSQSSIRFEGASDDQLDPELQSDTDSQPRASTSKRRDSNAPKGGENKKHWTPEEDKTLLKLVAERGPKNWRIIGEIMGTGRSGPSCCARWCRLATGNKDLGEMADEVSAQHATISRGKRTRWLKWTPEDDERLKELVLEHGAFNWDDIAEKMGGSRTGEACNGRWMHVVRPRTTIEEGDLPRPPPSPMNAGQPRWRRQDDERLARAKAEHPKASWSFIGSLMDPKRSAGGCRARWNQHIQKGGAYAYYKKPKVLARRAAEAAARQAIDLGRVPPEDLPDHILAEQRAQMQHAGHDASAVAAAAAAAAAAEQQSAEDEAAQAAQQYTNIDEDDNEELENANDDDADLAFAQSLIEPMLIGEALQGTSNDNLDSQPADLSSNKTKKSRKKASRKKKMVEQQQDEPQQQIEPAQETTVEAQQAPIDHTAAQPIEQRAHLNPDAEETPGPKGQAWQSFEENKRLLELVERHGRKQWAKVAEELGTGRSAAAVSAQWQRLTDNGAKMPTDEQLAQPKRRAPPRPWTAEDDAELRQLVADLGKNAWVLIGQSMTRPRSAYGAMARWYDHVSKMPVASTSHSGEGTSAALTEHGEVAADENDVEQAVPRAPKKRWTKEEDDELVSVIDRLGDASWSEVSRTLAVERPATACRLRWVNYLMHQPEYAELAARVGAAPRTNAPRRNKPRRTTTSSRRRQQSDDLGSHDSTLMFINDSAHSQELMGTHSSDHLPPMPTNDIDLNAFLAHLSQAGTSDGSLPFLHATSGDHSLGASVEDEALRHSDHSHHGTSSGPGQEGVVAPELVSTYGQGHKRAIDDTNHNDQDDDTNQYIHEEHHHVEKRTRLV